jgi:peroxiredoxin
MRILLSLALAAGVLAAADGPRRAPGFSLPDQKMQFHDLNDYRGKVVVIDFMKTDCPHCATFADVLAKVAAKYGSKVQVLSVALPPDTQATIGRFATGHKVNYPMLYDMGQMAFSYVRSQNMELPRAYLIDQQGMIRGDFSYDAFSKSVFEGNGLSNEIDKLLGTSGAAPAKKK